jgi:hypothetical protein
VAVGGGIVAVGGRGVLVGTVGVRLGVEIGRLGVGVRLALGWQPAISKEISVRSTVSMAGVKPGSRPLFFECLE